MFDAGDSEEKPLCHVAMLAQFLDDNSNRKRHFKVHSHFFQTSSILFSFTDLMCQMLAKFSGLHPKGPYLSL